MSIIRTVTTLFALGLMSVSAELRALNAHDIAAGSSLGDGLFFRSKASLPLRSDEASARGYQPETGECDPSLGVKWVTVSDDATPIDLYYTSTGMIAGLSVRVVGEGAAPQALVERGFWRETKDGHDIAVSFRHPSYMCDEQRAEEPVGDRVVINQDTIAWNMPLTASSARDIGYGSGSCLNTMGTHYFWDFNGHQSYNEDALLPVVPMYYPQDTTGVINAIFFGTPLVQEDVPMWDTPKGIPPTYMCYNWCDDDCHWDTVWSTMHIYFNSNLEDLACEGADKIGRSCKNISRTSISSWLKQLWDTLTLV